MKNTPMRFLAVILAVVAALSILAWGGVAPAKKARFADNLTASGQVSQSPVPSNAFVEGIYISGTFTATVTFEGSIDGTNYFAINATPVNGGTAVTTATAGGQWLVDVSGLVATQVRCSAYTSGTIVVSNHFGAGSAAATVSVTGTPSTVDQTKIAGTTIDTNSGSKSAGTQRVVIATDQPSLSNALPVSQSGTWTVQPGNTANTTAWLTARELPSGATQEVFCSEESGGDITDNSAHEVFAARGASIKHYITMIAISNTHATVSTKVKILDGTTKLTTLNAAASSGGWIMKFDPPLVTPTANAALNVQCGTTGASVQVNVYGYYR
jgi:hypothetical protein